MKKYLLTALLICAVGKVIAQNSPSAAQSIDVNESGKNEIKVNLLNSILALPEISYERIMEDNMSVGISLAVGIGTEDDFSQYKFLAIPHYRLFFGRKRAAGFFIEGNLAVGSVKEKYQNFNYSGNSVNYATQQSINFGLGAAVGAKFLTKNGFLGEVFGGLGRFFGDDRIAEVYPRIGVTLGKRF